MSTFGRARTAGDLSERSRQAVLRELRDLQNRQTYSLLDRTYYAARRLRALTAGQQNPCKRSFYTFLANCVWSVDEARGGEVRPWPTGEGADGRSWDRYWFEIEDALLQNKLLMFEKSRRVLASWCVCAFDCWLCMGGQDPRWTNEQGLPVLMQSDRNRQVFLQARKMEGPAGAEWFIEQRVKRILDLFEEHGRVHWPDAPRWKWVTGEIEFSNGSKISGVPQGPNQIRGAASTLLHCEELAFWEQAKKTVAAAIPTMRGGGHIVGVTTPNVGSYAQDIRDGNIRRDR